jgi:inner membrane transporter RhtA
MKPTPAALVPLGALLIAMVSIQAGASFSKSLFPAVGPEGTTTLRLVLAAIMLAIVLRPWRAKITKDNWGAVTLYGIILGGMNLCFALALDRIPLGIAAAVQFIGPLAVALLSSRRRLDFLWVLLAVMGLLLLLPIDTSVAALDPVGIAYALGSGLGWALYIVVGKRAGAAHGAQTPALGMIIAAVVVLPIGIDHAGAALLTPALMPLALTVAALSSALPFALEMVALRRLSALTYGTLTSMEPAIGALSGLLILHEMLPPLQWLAIGLVICASIGATVTMKADGK